MVLKLYMRKSSPPCRAVLMTAKILDVPLKLIQVNRSEHLTPEFVKLNPQHTVPTLVDDGKIIWDSHAINAYLVEKYAKDDSLYPDDPYKRGVINQLLHFDTGVVFATAKVIRNLIVLKGVKKIPQELIYSMYEVYGLLEKFLDGSSWIAGDEVTLADLSLITSITTCDVLVQIDANRFPNITGWLKRAKYLPYYGINQEGLELFKNSIQSHLNNQFKILA